MAAQITLQMVDGTAQGFNSLLSRMKTLDPEIEKLAIAFQGVGSNVKAMGPLATGMGRSVGMAVNAVGRALGPIGLAIGGVSIAMSLLGDETEGVGEEARKAASELEGLLRLQADFNRLRQELATGPRMFDSTLAEQQVEATNRINELMREQAQLVVEMHDLRKKQRDAEAAGNTDVAEASKTLAKQTQRDIDATTKAIEAQHAARNRAIEGERRLRQQTADEFNSFQLEQQKAAFQEQASLDEIVATREELQRRMETLQQVMRQNIDLGRVDAEQDRELLADIKEAQADINRLVAEEGERRSEIERAADEEIRALEKVTREREKATAEAMKLREKEIDAARKQFAGEVDLLRDKLMEEKNLREGVSGDQRSVFQRLAAGVGREDVVSQLAAERRQAGPVTDRRGRELTDQQLAAQVRRELQRGQISGDQIQAAQAEVVAAQAREAGRRGDLDRKNVSALTELAKGFTEQAREAAETARRLEQIETAIGSTRESAQRDRARRRTTRG